MLFGCVVDNDIQLAELLYSLGDSFSTKLFLTEVAFNQQAFAALFFDQTLGFVRILLFFEVNHGNVSAFLSECDGNRATDPTVAASNDCHFVSQLSTAAVIFVLGSRPRLHLVFAAGLPS